MGQFYDATDPLSIWKNTEKIHLEPNSLGILICESTPT